MALKQPLLFAVYLLHLEIGSVGCSVADMILKI